MTVHKHLDIDAMLKCMGVIEFGVAHWFDHDQGFGFITPDDGGTDIFVDLSEVARGRHRPLQAANERATGSAEHNNGNTPSPSRRVSTERSSSDEQAQPRAQRPIMGN